jgi:hypothetical protein
MVSKEKLLASKAIARTGAMVQNRVVSSAVNLKQHSEPEVASTLCNTKDISFPVCDDERRRPAQPLRSGPWRGRRAKNERTRCGVIEFVNQTEIIRRINAKDLTATQQFKP